MLISEDERFEVIACDDASTDNAKELLTKIHDKRFHYYRNEKNLGAHKNWEHSLELGTGEWLYLVMGRDKLHGENIDNLINLLNTARKNNILLLKDGRPSKQNGLKIFTGIQAMINFVLWDHPTGLIFDRQTFAAIPNRGRYFEIADMYPECFIERDMLLKGGGSFIYSGVYRWEFIINYAKIKSTVEPNNKLYDAYYAPRRSITQCFNMIDMIDDLKNVFTEKEKDKYFSARFYSLLYRVSEIWRNWCGSEASQKHYGHDVVNITICEMLRNIFTAHNATKTHLKEKGTYTFKRQLMMCNSMLKIILFILIYLPIKNTVKKILEPLGIWTALKRMKNFVRKN